MEFVGLLTHRACPLSVRPCRFFPHSPLAISQTPPPFPSHYLHRESVCPQAKGPSACRWAGGRREFCSITLGTRSQTAWSRSTLLHLSHSVRCATTIYACRTSQSPLPILPDSLDLRLLQFDRPCFPSSFHFSSSQPLPESHTVPSESIQQPRSQSRALSHLSLTVSAFSPKKSLHLTFPRTQLNRPFTSRRVPPFVTAHGLGI